MEYTNLCGERKDDVIDDIDGKIFSEKSDQIEPAPKMGSHKAQRILK